MSVVAIEMSECDSTIHKIEQTSIDIESPIHPPSISAAESLELTSSVPADPPVICDSIYAALVLNPNYYFLAAMSGLIVPIANDYPKSMTTFKWFRFRIWSIFLSAGCYFVVAILYVAAFPSAPDNYKAESFFLNFSLALQFIILYPAIKITRKIILAKREIVVNDFNEHWKYAIQLSSKVFAFWTLLSIINTIVLTLSPRVDYDADSATREAVLYLILHVPPNTFMMGLLCFLVYEQRLSRQMMDGILKDLDCEKLTLKKYFSVRGDMENRDQASPINLILLSCIVNLAVGLSLIYWLYVELDDKDVSDNALNSFDVIATFGPLYIFIIVFLLEIIGVNERADKVVPSIAKYNLESEVDQTYRFGIYMTAKEYPLGSMILFARPSRLQLLTEIGSSIFGICISIVWALLNR
eukprot:gene30043-39234_t